MSLIDTYIRHEIASLGLEFVPEFRFHDKRLWRFDYAIPSLKIGIEIQGATYAAGRHTRGTGYANDCEKLNAAQCLGWRVLWYTTQQLKADPSVVARDIQLLLNKNKEDDMSGLSEQIIEINSEIRYRRLVLEAAENCGCATLPSIAVNRDEIADLEQIRANLDSIGGE